MANGKNTRLIQFQIESIHIVVIFLAAIFSLDFLFVHYITSLPLSQLLIVILSIIGGTLGIGNYICSMYPQFKEWLSQSVQLKYLLVVTSLVVLLFSVAFFVNLDKFSPVPEKIKIILPNGKVEVLPDIYAKTDELTSIFPQVTQQMFVSTSTFATNGIARSQFHSTPLDEKKTFTELYFLNWRTSSESNTGWMIGPLGGYDVSSYKYLSFWVKGKNGDEAIGIKFKDTHGFEFSSNITDFLEERKISTRWQKANVPLYIFQVDATSLHIITIYSDGGMHAIDPQTVYITDFEFF